nr:hypothetical protein Q903MT_gene1349 [Picea sitchensis]
MNRFQGRYFIFLLFRYIMSLFPSLAFYSPKSVRLEPDCSLSELMSEPACFDVRLRSFIYIGQNQEWTSQGPRML